MPIKEKEKRNMLHICLYVCMSVCRISSNTFSLVGCWEVSHSPRHHHHHHHYHHHSSEQTLQDHRYARAGRCLLAVAIIIIVIIIIIIIALVGKPSRTKDLLGSSFLIHTEISKGVNSAIGNTWNVFSGFRKYFVRVWKPPMAIFFLREVTRVFWPMTCMRRANHACAWSKLVYACVPMRAQS